MDTLHTESILDRSRASRSRAAGLAEAIAATRARVTAERRRSLITTTEAADGPLPGHPVMLSRLARLSASAGRSPEIERAKLLIAERYGISRGEAFDILRRMSSHTNRKLSAIAADVVAADGAGGA